jgi:propionyl-CoA carboxylase beta chain
MLRRLFNYLPLNNREKPPVRPAATRRPHRPSLDTLVPDNPNKPYDMKELILKTVDDGDFFELQPDYAKNIVIGFARMDGQTVGIVANQPLVLAGCLDIKSSIKAARFVRFCDAFNIPVITFVDVPGFMPGTSAGVRRHHQARRQAAVRLCRVHRAQGHGDHPQGLRRRLRRDELQAPARRRQLRLAERRDRGDGRRRARWRSSSARTRATRPSWPRARRSTRPEVRQPLRRRRRGFIDDVIMPHETRKRICRSLAMLRDKKLENPWRKHGNIPL